MSLSIRATDSNGTISETPIGHFDLIKATYGIGDTVEVSHVINVMISLIVGSVFFGIGLAADDTVVKIACLTIGFQPVGYFLAGTARTRHMTKTLVKVMNYSPIPMIVVMAASYLTAFAAAALCVLGGGYGIAGGIALILINPVVRFTGDIGLALRIWKAKRHENKLAKARKEGLGD